MTFFTIELSENDKCLGIPVVGDYCNGIRKLAALRFGLGQLEVDVMKMTLNA